MSIPTVHLDFGKKGKGNAEAAFAECCDFLLAVWLLLAELVTGKSEHDQSALAVTLPQRFQPLVLRGKTTLTGRIDHQQHLCIEIREPLLLALDGDAGNVQQWVVHARLLATDDAQASRGFRLREAELMQ